MRKPTSQGLLPAASLVVNVGAAPRRFTGQVDRNARRSTHNPDQIPLGQHLAAPDTSPLRNMFHAFSRFFGHLSFSSTAPTPIRIPNPNLRLRGGVCGTRSSRLYQGRIPPGRASSFSCPSSWSMTRIHPLLPLLQERSPGLPVCAVRTAYRRKLLPPQVRAPLRRRARRQPVLLQPFLLRLLRPGLRLLRSRLPVRG